MHESCFGMDNRSAQKTHAVEGNEIYMRYEKLAKKINTQS